MKYFLIMSALLLTLTSCVPDPIDIEIEPPQSEIVVASQIIPGQTMLVSLTRSFSALSYNEEEGDSLTDDFLTDLLVTRARVTVSFAGQTEELFHLGNGVYGSLTTLQIPNEYYTLTVFDSTNNETVTAQTQMLPFVPFDTLFPVIERTNSDTTIFLDYTLSDSPGDNFYVLSVIKRNDDTSGVGIDLNSFFGVGLNVVTQTRLISDKEFGGNTINERFRLFEIEPDDSVVVTLSNVSREYFDYLTAQARSQGLVSEITQEPINRPTNVNGGRGFFNAYFPDARVFDLTEW